MRTAILAAATLVALSISTQAGGITSAYTKIDFQKTCKVLEEIEEGVSVSMLCEGYKGYGVHFAEGDLRQAVRFGHIDANSNALWQSFGQWNRIGATVEWRLKDGRPQAAILRWFIENIDDAGSADPTKVGQVLVVSRVAQPEDKQACVAGYIDARANKDANVLARRIADTIAPTFKCGKDSADFHGARGNLSGNPS
jgi:hypothetical protein